MNIGRQDWAKPFLEGKKGLMTYEVTRMSPFAILEDYYGDREYGILLTTVTSREEADRRTSRLFTADIYGDDMAYIKPRPGIYFINHGGSIDSAEMFQHMQHYEGYHGIQLVRLYLPVRQINGELFDTIEKVKRIYTPRIILSWED